MMLSLVSAAILAVMLAVILIVRDLIDRRRAFWKQHWQKPDADEGGTTLVRLAARKPPNWAGRIDQAFQSMIERTGLPISAQQAVGTIVLCGAVVATALVLWRESYWLGAVGVLTRFALPFLCLLLMQARWRVRVSGPLPRAFFFVAAALPAGPGP